MKHKRLFVPVINDVFDRNYPKDVKVDILSSEGYLTESETADGSKEIEELYRRKAVRGMGHRPCDHPHAEVFHHIYQENRQDAQGHHYHLHWVLFSREV